MLGFLACAGLTSEKRPSPLETSVRVMRSVIASPQTEVAVLHRRLPDVRVGWYGLAPAAGAASVFITEAVDDEIAVLSYGALFEESQAASVAAAVAAAWRSGGPARVRALDGCFGALLIDRQDGTLFLLSDSIGRRALRYCVLPDAILVSTHDLPIVATGLCPPDLDLLSAASVLTFGWSIGPTSLVRGIEPCDPNEYVRWSNRKIERVWDPPIRTCARLEQGDSGGRIGKVDQMIELTRANTRRFVRDHSEVDVDLTAGLDSRTVLAITLSLQPRPPLTAVTAGRHSTDVRIARLLARLYDVPRRTSVPNTRNTDAFFEHLRLRAYAMNGATHGKRAVDPPPNLTGRSPTLSGTGGEVYRGFYYGTLRDQDLLQERPVTAAQAILDANISRRPCDWLDADLVRELTERHLFYFERFTRISGVVADLLDVFFVQETLGRWAEDARCFWLAPTFAPFESPQLVRLSFELPPPMSNHMVLHKTILRQHARAAFYLPVNQRYLLPLSKHTKERSRTERLIRSGLSFTEKLSEQVRTVTSSESVASHDQIRSHLFRSLLLDGLQDLILESNSVSRQIADSDYLDTVIREHADGRANHLETIGLLATIEEYRRTLDEAAGMAKRFRYH